MSPLYAALCDLAVARDEFNISRAAGRRIAEEEAEDDSYQAEKDVSAARPAVDAIKAISRNDLTPEVFAQLLSVLSGAVAQASWSHTAEAEHVSQSLDDLSDLLTGGA